MNTINDITVTTRKNLEASGESVIRKTAKRKEYFKKYEQSKRGIERQKKYYLRNKEKIKKRTLDYYNKRRKTDNAFRLIINLRARLNKAINSYNKSNSTMVLLGVPNIEFLWNHLEKTFKPGMTRENYGKWHIDHIIPCSSFNMENPKDQFKCFHYTNLQALWAHENLSKSNKSVA
jgi:hypothetical protein